MIFDGTSKPKPKIKYTFENAGDVTSLDFVANGQQVKVTETFINEDVVVIDSDKKTVTKNGEGIDYQGRIPEMEVGENIFETNLYTASGTTLDQSQETNTGIKQFWGTRKLAQSFTVSTKCLVPKISLILSKIGTPTNDVTVRIETDAVGAPSGTLVTNGSITIIPSKISSSPIWLNSVMSLPILATATTYWIVVNTTGGDSENAYKWHLSITDKYAGKAFRYVSSWTELTNNDFCFKIYKNIADVLNSDNSDEVFTENFSTDTYKDASNTTADWDTMMGILWPKISNTGVTNGGTFSTMETIGSFTNPSNASASDNVYATSTVTAGQYMSSGWLIATNFGFSIPTDACIKGIKIEVEEKCSDVRNIRTEYGIRYNSGYLGSVMSSTKNSTTSDTYYTYGSSTELFDYGMTPAIINDSSFGVRLLYIANNYSTTFTYSVDHIRVTIYYATTGQVGQSLTLDSGSSVIASATLTETATKPEGTSTALAMSSDGTNFETVTSGVEKYFANIASALKFKATLTGTTTATPEIDTLAISYKTAGIITATTHRVSQSFIAGFTGGLGRIKLNVKKFGSPGNLTVKIYSNSGVLPNSELATQTYTGSTLNDQFGWITINFNTPAALTSATTYWIVISAATVDGSNGYLIRTRAGNKYANGTLKYSTNSGTNYTEYTNEDILFETYPTSGLAHVVNLVISYTKRWL